MNKLWVEYDQENWKTGKIVHKRKEFTNRELFLKEFRYDKLCSDIKNLKISCIICGRVKKITPKKFEETHRYKMSSNVIVLKGKRCRGIDEYCSERCRNIEKE